MRRTQRFIEELNRRNVIRAGFAYLLFSWLAAQIADLLSDIFSAPDWLMQLVILALAVGFPIALILSWVYEITDHGIVKTSEVVPNLSITRITGRKIDFIIIGVMAVGLIIFAIDRAVWRNSTISASRSALAIAVLPFDLHESVVAPFYRQIAADVAKRLERQLNVSLASRDAIAALPAELQPDQIASRLGVQYLVSGFIDLSGNRLKISVSIFEATSNSTTEIPNIDIQNLPHVDSIIAEQALSAMGVQQPKMRQHGVDPQAYEIYLKAQQTWEASSSDKEQTYALLEKAIEIEPQFAFAHALMCRYFVYEYQKNKSLDSFERAERRCFRAWRLDGESLEVLFAMGRLYESSGQLEEAMKSFQAVLELNPYHYEARLGVIESMAQSKPAIAELEYKRLIQDHPGSPAAYDSFVYFLHLKGRYEEAVEYASTRYRLQPTESAASNLSGLLMLAGHFQRALDFLEKQEAAEIKDASLMQNLATSKYFVGDFAGAARLYRDALEVRPDSPATSRSYGDAIFHLEGKEAARQAFEKVVSISLQHLTINPNNDDLLADLVVAYASLGNRERFDYCMSEILEKRPGEPQALYSIAVGASRLGDLATARQFIEQAREAGYPPALLDADPDIEAVGT